MLTDNQIHDLADRMNIPLQGVYFKDELPRQLVTNHTYIVNLQDSVNDAGIDNEGTHWTMLQINKTPNGKLHPIYFDPYGQPPPEIIKHRVMKNYKVHLPYTTKDVQSLMNNACGFYCLAMAHYINAYEGRTGDFYTDVDDFLEHFDDLNKKVDFKKNEYILKMFFQAKDPKLRKAIEVLKPIESIVSEDSGKGIDPFQNGTGDYVKFSVETKYIN